MIPGAIDPVCLVHGRRKSEHLCLYCCLCFRPLTIEECHVLPDGSREDVCDDCVEQELRWGLWTVLVALRSHRKNLLAAT